MSKKILSIILTIAVILCQGTLCLGTVYAADLSVVDPDRPSDEIPEGAEVWSLEFKDEADLAAFNPSGNSDKITLEQVDGEYLQLTTKSVYINANGNPNGYYADYVMPVQLDMDRYYKMQIRMKVVDLQSESTYFKLYFESTDANGSKLGMSENDCEAYNYALLGDKGAQYSDWMTFDIDLSKSTRWQNGKTLVKFRPDFLKNAIGTVQVDYIRIVAVPAIEKLTYNSVNDIDEVVGMPVNPETIEISLSHGINSVDVDAIDFVDVEGNPVSVEKATLSLDGKTISVTLAQELAENTEYVIGINENAKAGVGVNLAQAVQTSFTTGTYRAPTILDIIDPDRPIDEEPVHVYRSWEFKDAADIAYFPSKKDGTYVTEHMYGEYMQITFGTPIKNSNGNWAGHYTDTDLKAEPLNADVVTHMQVRMKVVNETFAEFDPQLRLYFAGTKEDGSTFGMSAATGILSNEGYKMKTDENGNYCTDWFVETIDLSTFGAWVDAKTITSVRVNVMENCSGVALVDYVRFIGYVPEVESVTYTDANGTADVTEDIYLPANTQSFEITLTDVVADLKKENVSLVSEFGTVTAVDSVAVDATGKILTINLAEELEKSAEYTLTAKPLIAGSMLIAEPIVVKFNTELDPLNAKVTKAADGKSATVEYTNATGEDAVLVAIATSWKQAQQAVEKDGKTEYVDIPGRVEYLGKNMTVNSVAAGSTASAYLTFDVDAEKSEFVEIVIWKYNTATGEYTVFSKKVN